MAKAESKKAAREAEASGGSLMDTTNTRERVCESDGLIRESGEEEPRQSGGDKRFGSLIGTTDTRES